MTMNKAKANAKKLKFKHFLQKAEEEEDEGSISSDDVDDLEDMMVGNIINDEYIIIKYVNRGTFSRVWLAYHLITSELRILKMYFKDDVDEFDAESRIFNYLRVRNQGIAQLQYNLLPLDVFTYQENGNCYHIIVLPVMGHSIDDIKEIYKDNDKKFTLDEAKYITKQLLLAVNELHQNKVMHTDIKLDNLLTNYHNLKYKHFETWFNNSNFHEKYNSILLNLIPEDYEQQNKDKRKKIKRKVRHRAIQELGSQMKIMISDYNHQRECEEDLNDIDIENTQNIDIVNLHIKMIDYSNAILMEDVKEDDEYQIRAFRAPENIMGYPVDGKNEVWAVGCFLWKLLTGEYIFEPELLGSSDRRDREQLWNMYNYLGPMELDYTMDCPRSYELFEDTGKIKEYKKTHRQYIDKMLMEKRPDLTEKEILETCNYINRIWEYKVKRRYSVIEALEDPYLMI